MKGDQEGDNGVLMISERPTVFSFFFLDYAETQMKMSLSYQNQLLPNLVISIISLCICLS